MTRCIIHIGMHKTGTSSIQSSLEGFADSHYLYADLGKSGNHSLAMYSLFASRPEQHHLHRSNQRDPAQVQEYVTAMRANLERSIDALRGRCLVISGEDIGVLPEPDVGRMGEYFRARFAEVTIVAYVRSPAAFMASAFQQRVKGGAAGPLQLENEYRNYQQSFAKFDRVFGRDNVHLWKFDPKVFPDGCVVRDFCSRLGIDLPPKRIVRVNESLTRQAVALLYTYRLLGQGYGSREMRAPEGQRLGTLLAATGKDKFRFSPDVVAPILKKNRADIKWMEARLGQPLKDDLGAHQSGDVRSQADLLKPDPEVVSRLLGLLGDSAPEGVQGRTPEEVALLVHALRKLALPPGKRLAGASLLPGQGSGRIMRAEPTRVMGWAIGPDIARPVEVTLLVNGVEVARALANKPRPRLKEQGLHPTGYCGFVFRFEADQMLHEGDEVTVRPVDSSFMLANAPCVVSEANASVT